LYGFGLECGVMNGYDVSWVPTRHKTLTWYARFKYICTFW
jgi:hypothetical protein